MAKARQAAKQAQGDKSATSAGQTQSQGTGQSQQWNFDCGFLWFMSGDGDVRMICYAMPMNDIWIDRMNLDSILFSLIMNHLFFGNSTCWEKDGRIYVTSKKWSFVHVFHHLSAYTISLVDMSDFSSHLGKKPVRLINPWIVWQTFQNTVMCQFLSHNHHSEYKIYTTSITSVWYLTQQWDAKF
jgi:hypothetical protein